MSEPKNTQKNTPAPSRVCKRKDRMEVEPTRRSLRLLNRAKAEMLAKQEMQTLEKEIPQTDRTEDKKLQLPNSSQALDSAFLESQRFADIFNEALFTKEMFTTITGVYRAIQQPGAFLSGNSGAEQDKLKEQGIKGQKAWTEILEKTRTKYDALCTIVAYYDDYFSAWTDNYTPAPLNKDYHSDARRIHSASKLLRQKAWKHWFIVNRLMNAYPYLNRYSFNVSELMNDLVVVDKEDKEFELADLVQLFDSAAITGGKPPKTNAKKKATKKAHK